MDATILAGGETPENLVKELGASAPVERALLSVGGRPAVEYVVKSLEAAGLVHKITVIGLPRTLSFLESEMPAVHRVPAAATLSENLMQALDMAETEQLLVCGCDIPLVTPQTWREFLETVEINRLEAAYPVVAREHVEKDFPKSKRTYAKLAEGTFTGGNAFVLPRANREQLRGLVDTAYSARKNPFKLARLLGVGFLLKAVSQRLSIADLEVKLSRLLECRAGAVQMQDAALAFDIDKKEDYDLAQTVLGS